MFQTGWVAIVLAIAAAISSAQPCPYAEKIDLGWSELSPWGAGAFEVFDFDGPGPEPARLVALGSFTRAGAVEAPGLAAWNGTEWAAIPGSPTPPKAMVTFDDGTGTALYVARGPALHRFDGLAWTTIAFPDYGGLFALNASALTVMDPDGDGPLPAALYAAVWYTDRVHVHQMDAAGWTPVAGLISGELYSVRLAGYDADDIEPEPPKLHLICNFWHEEPGPGSSFGYGRIYRVDGASLTTIASPGAQCLAVAVHDSDGSGPVLPSLYVSTDSSNGPGGTQGIGAWDGAMWYDVGEGRFGVSAMCSYDADGPGPGLPVLVADGQSPGSTQHDFAAWNGIAWEPFAGGVGGYAWAMREIERDGAGNRALAVSGSLALAGRSSYTFGVWNGDAWAPFPPRPEGLIRALAIFNDGSGQRLFAAGDFDAVGTETAFNIAKWDGETWAALPRGIEPNAQIPAPIVYTMVVHNDGSGWALYAGGSFAAAGGATGPIHNIAKWNGLAWSGVGPIGVNGPVFALEVHDPDGSGPAPAKLYAAGGFTLASGLPARHLAAWDGAAWSEAGGGTEGFARALQSWTYAGEPALYVGGDPLFPSSASPSTVVVLTAGGWQPLARPGNGQGRVNAFAVFNDGAGQRLHAAGGVRISSLVTSALMRLDESVWTEVFAQFSGSYYEGLSARSVNEGGVRALYFGTNHGLFRVAGGEQTYVSDGGYSGIPVRSITPMFDDGHGPAVFTAHGPLEFPGIVSATQVFRVQPCPACYANCDASAVMPVLNANDFVCFLNRFGAGEAWANCDGSTHAPVLNVADFVCFMNKYAAGCP